VVLDGANGRRLPSGLTAVHGPQAVSHWAQSKDAAIIRPVAWWWKFQTGTPGYRLTARYAGDPHPAPVDLDVQGRI